MDGFSAISPTPNLPTPILPTRNQNVPCKKQCHKVYIRNTWSSKLETFLFFFFGHFSMCTDSEYEDTYTKRCMTGDKIAPFNSIASVGLAQAHLSDLSLLCLSNCSCTISRAVTEKSHTSTVPKGRAESPFGIVCPITNNSLSRGVPGIKS